MVGRLGAATAAQKGSQPDGLIQKSGMDLAVPVKQNTDKPMTSEKPRMDVKDLNAQFQQTCRLESQTWSLALPLGET